MVVDSLRGWIRKESFALILCLLAVVFALEAKIAWYMPPHTLGSEVQDAKALPADTPQLIPHGLSGQPPLFIFLPFTFLFALAAVCICRPLFYCGVKVNDRSPSSSSAFSPGNFFRPPPVL